MRKYITCAVYFVCCLTAIAAAPFQIRAEEGAAISKDGVSISYSVYGKGEPALVFIHGWSCNRSVWKKQVPFFKKKYRVVTLDLAGHGRSGKERAVYSLEAFGEDVAAVVRAIHAPQVVLLGHSMGGAVIIEAAEIMPDRVIALVGIDTMQDFEEAHTAEQIKEIVKPFKDDFKKATDSFVRSMFVKDTPAGFMREIIGMMTHADPAVGISAMEELFAASYVEHPPKINVPVWVLNADLWPTNPEVNRKYVPEFNLSIMPGRGHFLMLESPGEFNKRLDEIITEIVRRE